MNAMELVKMSRKKVLMLEQLQELAEMQQKYDNAVMKKHDLIYNYQIVNKVKIALFVELGEFLNELPSKFKYWKKTAKDDRTKALEEFVDILHFQLSLYNFYRINLNNNLYDYYRIYDWYKGEELEFNDIAQYIYYIYNNTDRMLVYLFLLGVVCDFTWEQIYHAYKIKNKINWERLKSGY